MSQAAVHTLEQLEQLISPQAGSIAEQDWISKQHLVDELRLQYLASDSILYSLAIFRGKPHLFQTPIHADSLANQVQQFSEGLRRTPDILARSNPELNQQHFYEQARKGHQLYQLLFKAPALQEILKQVEVVYVIPDPILNEIPFGALVTKFNDTPEFLIEHLALVQRQSFFQRNISKKNINDSSKVVLFGSPNFPGFNSLSLFAQQSFETKPGIITQSSSLRDLLSQSSDVKILVGHGKLIPGLENQSYVEVTGFDPNLNDYVTRNLTLSEARAIQWYNTRLMIFLACQIGGGSALNGYWRQGFHEAFLQNGGKTAIASFLDINAETAIPIIKKMLQYLSQGMPAAKAFQLAQVESIGNLRKDPFYRNPHPYLWGSMQMFSQ